MFYDELTRQLNESSLGKRENFNSDGVSLFNKEMDERPVPFLTIYVYLLGFVG